MRIAQDLFRSRRIGQFFPIGVVVSFILGIVAAPTLLGSASALRVVFGGLVLGLIGSAALFGLLKFFDKR
jgi:hypothetical protein